MPNPIQSSNPFNLSLSFLIIGINAGGPHNQGVNHIILYIYMLNFTVELTALKVKLEDLLLKKITTILNRFDNPYMGEVPLHGGVPFIWNTPDKGSALVIPYPNFRICMFLFFVFSFFFFNRAHSQPRNSILGFLHQTESELSEPQFHAF